MRVEFNGLSDTEKWAKELAARFTRPCVVLLDGDLGAGKTQFVRWFVEALGGSPASSPTFAVHQAYECLGGTIDHVDLYRVRGLEDLDSTGFWDLLAAPDVLMFVEWADRLPESAWPREVRRFRIRIYRRETEPEFRAVDLQVPGSFL